MTTSFWVCSCDGVSDVGVRPSDSQETPTGGAPHDALTTSSTDSGGGASTCSPLIICIKRRAAACPSSIGRLTHDGKRRAKQRRPVVIIETDEGDIFRASQPTFPEGVERAEGQLVGSHENSGGMLGQFEKILQHLVRTWQGLMVRCRPDHETGANGQGTVKPRVCSHNQFVVNREVRFMQGSFPTVEAIDLCADGFDAHQIGDSPMAETDQVANGLIGALFVVDPRHRRFEGRAATVKLDDWDIRLCQCDQRFTANSSGCNDQSVDLLGGQQMEVILFSRRVFVGVTEDRVVAMADHFIFDPTSHSRKEGVRDVGDNQPNDPSGIGDQAARNGIGPIAQGRNRIQHFLSRLVADKASAIDDVRYRRSRYPCFFRNMLAAWSRHRLLHRP